MTTSYVKKISEQLLKKSGKNINIQKLKVILQDHIDSSYNDNKLYKLVYNLKNRGVLVELKQGYYIIWSWKRQKYDQIWDEDYRYILSKYVKSRAGKEWMISGTKALELCLQNWDTPDDILILNDTIIWWEKLYHGKNVSFKTYNQAKKSIYKQFSKYSQKMIIADRKINVACIELSMLDTLNEWSLKQIKYQVEIIKKLLVKSRRPFSMDILEDIVKIWKHHTAINKLYKIAGALDWSLAKQIFDIIKRYSYTIKI